MIGWAEPLTFYCWFQSEEHWADLLISPSCCSWESPSQQPDTWLGINVAWSVFKTPWTALELSTMENKLLCYLWISVVL